MGMGAAKVEIDVNIGGKGSVKVNGIDLSDAVTGIVLTSGQGESTTVMLMIPADVELTGEGIVEVANMDAQRAIDIIDSIDAEELEQEVLGSLDLGDDGNVTQMILEHIKEKVRGD